MLKSREGKQPNPRFWADFVAVLTQLYPEATLDQSTLDSLYGLVLEQWRNGVQSHLIARQLCSCDGKQIVPSPAAQAHLQRFRGLARPPLDASPGQAFGPESLRAPTAIARVEREIRRIGTQIERGTRGMEVLARRAGRLSGVERDELLQTLSDAKEGLASLMARQMALASELASAVRGKPWEAEAQRLISTTEPKAKAEPSSPAARQSSGGPDLGVIRDLLLAGQGVLLSKRAYQIPSVKDVKAQDLGFGFRGGQAGGQPFSFQLDEGLKPLGGGLSYTVLTGNLSAIPFKDGTVGYDLSRAIAGVTAALPSAQLPPPRGEGKPQTSKPKGEKAAQPPKPPKAPRKRQNSQEAKPEPAELPAAPAQSPEIAGGGLPDDLVDDLINDLAKDS